MPDTLTRDIQSLCRLIDAGDDSVLPILADALEETGRPHGGLRDTDRLPRAQYGYFSSEGILVNLSSPEWHWDNGRPSRHRYSVGRRQFLRLRGGECRYGDSRAYPTRSAAFLALAAALSGQ